ncbi:hypothetical protein [Actinoplanes auranticolor]|uniref:Uncharacterized protein n=1 Tax=Actinoplanes auranticolor TaxID=47988 RepID=A0A919SGF5_9ACTN|nr:hypothetical protein [Actinoplanes auranticolor]GIM71219.1 hypothetical protein Aau02nite_44890 [Actinoplanes auranticolor]
MSVAKRLLELAASFADEVSRGDEQRFEDSVLVVTWRLDGGRIGS